MKEEVIKNKVMKIQEIIAMKKKEAKENVILSKDFKIPEQRLAGTFEENLYKYYQQNHPPQFHAEDYKEMSNTVYLGRCDADEAWGKENFPKDLSFIDLFVAKYDDGDWTVGYRYGEDSDYTCSKTSVSHCLAHNQAAIRALSLNIISYEEYIEAVFWGAGVKENFPYFVKAVLKKHGEFDAGIREFIKESQSR